jgi:hypothetical protein
VLARTRIQTLPGGLAFTVLAAALGFVGAARGQEGPDRPHIPDVLVSFKGPDLQVETWLAPGLPKDVEQRLSSGLPTTVTWRVRLFEFHNFWLWDSLKDERRYEVTATFRPVSGDWLVERRLDDRLLAADLVPTREEAARLLTRVPKVPFFTMGPQITGKPLVVRVRCLYSRSVSLGVVPTTFETDWRRSTIFAWNGGTRP